MANHWSNEYNVICLFITQASERKIENKVYVVAEPPSILYSSKMLIYRLAGLLNITVLWLSTSELTELNTIIAEVLLNSYLLPSVGVDNRSFQSYLKSGRLYASRQLPELTTVSFRATKSCELSQLTFLLTVAFQASSILSTARFDNPVNVSFSSYQNLFNCQSWHSC